MAGGERLKSRRTPEQVYKWDKGSANSAVFVSETSIINIFCFFGIDGLYVRHNEQVLSFLHDIKPFVVHSHSVGVVMKHFCHRFLSLFALYSPY